jgi:hypothetical protein
MEVLCERDPLVAVSPEDRWRAGIDGISSQFSDQLRRGLTTSLAIMGSMESNSHAIANTTGPEVASRIVSRILRVANEDNTGHLWSSLASSLSRLAEASPRDFLSALESALDQEPPLLLKMFGDTVTDRFGSSYSAHPNLLWALETLAWSPDYFANTAMILSRLAEIDPGGKLGNRPIASLISILYPAFPQTTATREARRNVATRIRTSYPEVSWKLMLSLLPNGVGGITLHSGPEFQTWKINEPIVTQREYVEVIRDIADDLLADVHIQVGRWVELLQSIQHLPPDKIDLVVEHFRRDLGALETFPERDRVWDEMRKFVAHQTTFRDASWAISDANFSLFAELLDQYQPIMDRNRWLFENHPQVAFDSSIRGDFEAKEKEIESLRMTAILNLARSQGYPAVKEFAEQVEAPGQVGAALARATHEEFDEQVLTLLIQNPDEQRDLTFGFCSVRFEQSGWDWLDRQLLRSGLPTTGLSLLLRSAREPIEAADRAGALGPEVESQYWRDFGIYGLGADFVEIRRVVEGLTNVRRTASALRFLAIYGIRGRSGSEMALQIAHAFETYIEDEESEREAFFLDEFELRSLLLIMLQHIDAVGMERAAAIEWYFLPALGVLDGTPILGYVLSRSPEWFVQMVCLVYKPEESVASDTSESSDEQRRMAQAAYQLLNSWNRCPGTDESGVLDGSALRHWVSKSRELLQESDRRRAGDDWIGVAMALAPIDPDGVWPHRAVRDLLEEIASQDVDRGFERKVSNSQGATSRSLFAGGGIERMRASEYQSLAASLRDEWPRLSAIFSRIAGTYERFAQREDTMAEKRRLGIDL